MIQVILFCAVQWIEFFAIKIHLLFLSFFFFLGGPFWQETVDAEILKAKIYLRLSLLGFLVLGQNRVLSASFCEEFC